MRTATALLLAALGVDTFHGSVFTMAQAAPAPGHAEQHVARPRYYFPRHVKRQVFPNVTVPATPSAPANPFAGLVNGIVGGVSIPPAVVSTPPTPPSAAPVPLPQVVLSSAAGTPEPASSSNAPAASPDAGLVGGIVSDVAAPLVTGVADPVVAPVVAPLVTGVVDPVVAPVVSNVAAPVVSNVAEPIVDGVAAPVVSNVAAPVVDGVAAPVVSEVAAPIVSDLAAPIVSDVAAPLVTGVVDPVVAPVVSNVAEPVVDGVAAPVVSGVASGVAAPVATGIVAPVADGVAAPIVSGVAGPTGALPVVVAPVVSGVAEPVVDGVAGPSGVVPGIAGPTGVLPVVVAPIASGVADPVVDGVAGPSGVVPGVVDPVVSGVAPIVSSAPDPSGVVPGVVDPIVTGIAPIASDGVSIVDPSGAVPVIVEPFPSGNAAPTGLLPPVIIAPTPSEPAVDPVLSGIAVPTGALPPFIVAPNPSEPAILPTPAESGLPGTGSGILVGLSTVLSGGAPAPTPAPSSEPLGLFPGAGITGPGTGGFATPTSVSANGPTEIAPPVESTVPRPPVSYSAPPPQIGNGGGQPATSLLAAPAPSGTATATASGIPTSMPKVIAPPGGQVDQPQNTTLIQIGFTHELNYAFVSTNPTSAQQVFTFLPQGIAYDLLLDHVQVRMFNIQPYDTSKSMGYITTLALLYVPTDMVNQLAIDLHTPNSGVYNSADSTTQTLMSFINPAIPLIAGQPMDGTAQAADAITGNGGEVISANSPQGGAPFGGDAGNSSSVKSSAVAIGTATAAGVVLYGAAMGLVARRYRNKKKKARHARNSSVTGSEPAWMSGGAHGRDSHGSGSSQGRSIRSQGISAPVMSENSLGWN